MPFFLWLNIVNSDFCLNLNLLSAFYFSFYLKVLIKPLLWKVKSKILLNFWLFINCYKVALNTSTLKAQQKKIIVLKQINTLSQLPTKQFLKMMSKKSWIRENVILSIYISRPMVLHSHNCESLGHLECFQNLKIIYWNIVLIGTITHNIKGGFRYQLSIFSLQIPFTRCYYSWNKTKE